MPPLPYHPNACRSCIAILADILAGIQPNGVKTSGTETFGVPYFMALKRIVRKRGYLNRLLGQVSPQFQMTFFSVGCIIYARNALKT